MDHQEKAERYFSEGYNCAQSVLLAFAEEYGIDTRSAAAIAGGFGGGMGRLGGTCGALTGAFMALGLAYRDADTGVEPRTAKEAAYVRIREAARRFRELHGVITCRELTGCDLATAEGREQFARRGLSREICDGLVRSAADIVEDMARKSDGETDA